MKTRRFGTLWLLVAYFVLPLGMRVLGQGIVTGSLAGTVQDQAGAVIRGSTVTAGQTATNATFKSSTGDTGAFQIPRLPIGDYAVTIEALGFVPIKVERVTVSTGSQTKFGHSDTEDWLF
jgi:Carboxypeptidase regulatory-like domain